MRKTINDCEIIPHVKTKTWAKIHFEDIIDNLILLNRDIDEISAENLMIELNAKYIGKPYYNWDDGI